MFLFLKGERNVEKKMKIHPLYIRRKAFGCYFHVRLVAVAHWRGRMCVINTWWSTAAGATATRWKKLESNVYLFLSFFVRRKKLAEVLYSLRWLSSLGREITWLTDWSVECVFCPVCVWPSVLRSRRKKNLKVIWMLYEAAALSRIDRPTDSWRGEKKMIKKFNRGISTTYELNIKDGSKQTGHKV